MTLTERYIERQGIGPAFDHARRAAIKGFYSRVRHDTFCVCCGDEQRNGAHLCVDCCDRIFTVVRTKL